MPNDYEKPDFTEIRMDAEIGAYQSDPLDPPFVSAALDADSDRSNAIDLA